MSLGLGKALANAHKIQRPVNSASLAGWISEAFDAAANFPNTTAPNPALAPLAPPTAVLATALAPALAPALVPDLAPAVAKSMIDDFVARAKPAIPALVTAVGIAGAFYFARKK